MTEHGAIQKFIRALQIMAKYIPKEFDTNPFLMWQGDEMLILTDGPPENSEDGKALLSLGWFINDMGYWAKFT